MTRRPWWLLPTLLCLALTGCYHLGPSSIVTDRIPYNNAIATSWQEQTLLNIVKVRYFDTPFFVDVTQDAEGIWKASGIGWGGLAARMNSALGGARPATMKIVFERDTMTTLLVAGDEGTESVFVLASKSPLAGTASDGYRVVSTEAFFAGLTAANQKAVEAAKRSRQ